MYYSKVLGRGSKPYREEMTKIVSYLGTVCKTKHYKSKLTEVTFCWTRILQKSPVYENGTSFLLKDLKYKDWFF